MDKFKKYINKLSATNQAILKGSFWILFGTILSKFLLLLSSIFITRYLDKTVYGEFGIIRSTINMFGVFAGLGLGITATKFISQFKNTDESRTVKIIGLSNLFSLVISVLVSTLFFLFSDKIAAQINAEQIESELKISSIILLFSALNGIQIGILSGFEKFKSISTNSIIAAIFSSILQVIGAKYYGLMGIVIGFGLNFFVLYVLNYLSIIKLTKSKFKFKIFDKKNFEEINILWRFSLPAVLSGLLISPIIWITNYLLVNEFDGFDQMANFEIANQWRSTILFIPGALAQVALPMLSSVHVSGFKEVFYRNLKINIVISFSIAIVVVLCSPIIISFYDGSYKDATTPLIIMVMTTSLTAINGIVSQAISSKDKLWYGLLFNFIWALVIVSCAYYFVTIKNLGAIGLSYAYLISYIVHTFIQFFYLKKIIN